MVSINNVKFHWLELAIATLNDLIDIEKERNKKLSYMKKWVEEAVFLGIDVDTQQLIYIAVKSKSKDGFYEFIGRAIDSQKKYIETL